MQIMSPDQLAGWLDTLAAAQTLIAPKDVDGVLLYQPVQGAAEVVLDYVRPVLSAKDVFFPATERLLTIAINGGQVQVETVLPAGKRVLFGVRPCDVAGIRALDAAFIQTEPMDCYYAQRRADTTLVGLACTQMGETCFCTSVGGAPDDSTGMDLMLTPVDGGYAVQVISEKGQALLADLPLAERPGEPPPPLLVEDIPVPAAEAWPALFSDDYWSEMAERCLSCRICAYVCPTCRCFDVRDEHAAAGNGYFDRVRCWDSCAGEVYRRIAGGHNPRAAKGDRLRNRFFCKFNYYPAQYGPLACTGCGRCIDSCPVNIDITEVLSHVAEVTP